MTGATRVLAATRPERATEEGSGSERISRETRYLLPVVLPVVLAGIAAVGAAIWHTVGDPPSLIAVAGVLGAPRRRALLRGVPRSGREPPGRAPLPLDGLHPRRGRALRLAGRGLRRRADARDARDRRAAAARQALLQRRRLRARGRRRRRGDDAVRFRTTTRRGSSSRCSPARPPSTPSTSC